MTDIKNKKSGFSVIIVAAGSGLRAETEIPKQYILINGKPILRHTIEAFLACPELQSLYIAINPHHQHLYESAVKNLSISPPIVGGNTRQKTVQNALNALTLKNDDIILIHDAARPFIQQEDIMAIVHAARTHPSVTLSGSISDTIRQKDGLFVGDTMNRDDLLAIQTPQAFHFGLLKQAHNEHQGTACTDDTTIMSLSGIRTVSVTAKNSNFKITTKDELKMAELILSKKCPPPIIKTASGFDVHAFGEKSSSLRIGGIDIPHTHKLSGHSDADVVLHAITDALYGTIADGDIGSHFPSNDPTHKGKDSAIFLKDACNAVIKKNGTINHIDVTIICETPKIGTHREPMRQKIAEIMELPISRVSVKATTTEKLGFTGRGEGIAAQAIVTISTIEEE